MAVVLFRITMLLYLAGAALFLVYLLRRFETLSKVAVAVTGVGFASHTIALVTQMSTVNHFPLISFHEAMSFFSWSLVLVFLVVGLKQRFYVFGSFILPLAFLSLLAAAVFSKEVSALQPVLKTVWVHVTLSMLGTVGFAVAFVAGVMYVMQDRLLKSKQFNVLYFKLPPLDSLDTLNQRSILLGFPFLTLGIVAGAISGQINLGSYVSWDPKQTLALVTWVFYLVVLIGRITVGWRAKKAAYLTIIGFSGVVLTFVGVVLKNHDPLTSL